RGPMLLVCTAQQSGLVPAPVAYLGSQSAMPPALATTAPRSAHVPMPPEPMQRHLVLRLDLPERAVLGPATVLTRKAIGLPPLVPMPIRAARIAPQWEIPLTQKPHTALHLEISARPRALTRSPWEPPQWRKAMTASLS